MATSMSYALVFAALVAICAARPEPQVAPAAPKGDEDLYTSRFDDVNLDDVLASERLLGNYFRCLMDRGPCTPDAAELKRHLPDALLNKCSRCTQKQRDGAEKVVQFVIKNRKAQWKELEAKYDPQGTYRKKYAKEAEDHGVVLPA